MVTEYGIFNDEGCLEGQIYSMDEANERLAVYAPDDEFAHIAEVCPWHEDQPKDYCEECAGDDE